MGTFTQMVVGSQADLMALEADASDMGYSAVDERVGARLAALPEVEAVTGVAFAYGSTEDAPLFFMMGYNPREFGIRHFRIVDGQPLATNRQMIVGHLIHWAIEKPVFIFGFLGFHVLHGPQRSVIAHLQVPAGLHRYGRRVAPAQAGRFGVEVPVLPYVPRLRALGNGPGHMPDRDVGRLLGV